jgi:hypothetical protein
VDKKLSNIIREEMKNQSPEVIATWLKPMLESDIQLLQILDKALLIHSNDNPDLSKEQIAILLEEMGL